MDEFARRYHEIQERIERACIRARRDPASVRLIAVSKLKPATDVRAAFDAGIRDFGENYVQELRAKHERLLDVSGLRWHLIGPLQSNKVRHAVSIVEAIHSIDSQRLLLEISRRAAALGRVIDGFIQVNLADEAQKAGCSPQYVSELVNAAIELPGVRIVGLMAIPPVSDDKDQRRARFARLRALAEEQWPPLTRLSMGMSDDFEAAIEEGATEVRVGTALFGARQVSG